MTQEWLLVETLGEQPVVVAQGRQIKNFVALATFLRRNPNIAAVQTAISETVATGTALTSITSKTKRVIRTEPITMSDGRIHAVHVWCGPTDAEPPERPIPGPLKWDFTTGESTGTPEYLTNAGMDPSLESMTGRAFAEDVPSRSLNRDEAKALSLAIDAAPDRTYCATWSFVDKQGLSRKVGWCARTAMETAEDGTEHLVARAMNLVEAVGDAASSTEPLADRILEGLAQPGVYRLMIDLENWRPLKWLDDPCPLVEWRGPQQMHPDDDAEIRPTMLAEFETGSTAGVLRLPAAGGGWVPMHVTITRVELDADIYAGLTILREPTAEELADSGLEPAGEKGL
ncbi:MAG: PAS domain-containing protein [Mycobacterium sp.]